TLETCQAMEDIDIKIPFEDYAQPYPVFIIKLPHAWQEYACKKTQSTRIFQYITVTRLPNLIGLQGYFTRKDNMILIVSDRGYDTIEDAISIPAILTLNE